MRNILLFSIIIPTYNRAHLLSRAIESIQQQVFQDWELIIIDDGSTDRTAQVVKEYLSDQRIKYHYQENQELNGARNTGIKKAEGHYLFFLDDDDFYTKDHLAVVYKFLEEKNWPEAIVKTGLIVHYPNSTVRIPFYEQIQHHSPVRYAWTETNGILTFGFHQTVFQEILFEKHYLLFDDIHFLIQALLKFPFFQINAYTAHYIKHEESRTNTYYIEEEKIKNYYQAVENLLQQYENELKDHLSPADIQLTFIKDALNFAYRHILARKYLGALKYYKKAFRAGLNFKLVLKYLPAHLKGLYLSIFR